MTMNATMQQPEARLAVAEQEHEPAGHAQPAEQRAGAAQ